MRGSAGMLCPSQREGKKGRGLRAPQGGRDKAGKVLYSTAHRPRRNVRGKDLKL